MKIIITSLFILLLTPLAAQMEVNNGSWFNKRDRVQGNGDLVTQSRNLDGFTGVSACCSFRVELTESGSFDVRVEAESNLQDFIETKVINGTLHIKFSDDANFKSTEDIRVFVSLPRLESIDASSSSRVIGKTPFSGEDLSLDVSSSALIDLQFTGKRVDLDASSSGQIMVKGSASRVTADASSASSIDAGGLEADDAVANVSSAASVAVHARNTLRADASSAGVVRYSGNPSDVVSDTSSAGRVRSAHEQ
ncbi:head GIN domain-containing protein [Neolewinella litorea]|nr:head GIN domain-containing protein [Neolewinella litorea]